MPSGWSGLSCSKRRFVLLNQMRRLVRQFNAAVVKRTSRLPLRLLTQPVSRFGQENSAVLDGAWFVFAKGTNPEVMLLVEARHGEDNDYAWYFSPVRMTSSACELKRENVVVWSVEGDRGDSPDRPYFNIYSQE